MIDYTLVEETGEKLDEVRNKRPAPHRPLGKNEAQRRFHDAWLTGRLTALSREYPETSCFFLAVSVAGSDVGQVYWPLVIDEGRWLLLDARSLKGEESRLKLKRKNPRHVVYFVPDVEAEVICSSERLRAKLTNGNLSNLSGNWLPSDVQNRIHTLPIAAYLDQIEKKWRRQNFVSLETTEFLDGV